MERIQVPAEPAGPVAPEAAAPAAPQVPAKFMKDGVLDSAALLAAYTELEKKQSTAKPEGTAEEAPAAGTENQETTEQQPVDHTEGGAWTIDTGTVEVLTKAGLKADGLIAEIKKDGKLSDQSYADLASKGFTKSMVDHYLAGMNASVESSAVTVASIKQSVGGEEGFAQLSTWVVEQVKSGAMTKADVIAYNAAIDSGDVAKAKLAVEGMYARYRNAEGFEPAVVVGGGSRPAPSVFRSAAEVQAAMNDSRYGVDPAYTRDVEAKAIRSNVYKR